MVEGFVKAGQAKQYKGHGLVKVPEVDYVFNPLQCYTAVYPYLLANAAAALFEPWGPDTKEVAKSLGVSRPEELYPLLESVNQLLVGCRTMYLTPEIDPVGQAKQTMAVLKVCGWYELPANLRAFYMTMVGNISLFTYRDFHLKSHITDAMPANIQSMYMTLNDLVGRCREYEKRKKEGWTGWLLRSLGLRK